MRANLAPEQLVALLASPLGPVRDRAGDALTALGAQARPALQAGLTHPNAEIRQQCAALLRRLPPPGHPALQRLRQAVATRGARRQPTLPGPAQPEP